ncbi:DUF4350 domain-containing protein [Dongia sp.]|uniref:DUF4350 domain-containing protein n=1 Tax=Dongia sp. TaxID=1977262 RepID=UPI003752BC4F
MTATAAKRPGLRGSSAGPFPLITLILVIVIGVGAFFTATYLEMFGNGDGEPLTNQHNVYSRSAIGHRAFAAALRNLDIPVQVSRFQSLERAGSGSLLLMIEPDFSPETGPQIGKLRDLPQALLVLPKWAGFTDFKKPIWVGRMDLLPEDEPKSVLRAVLRDAVIQRDTGSAEIDAPHFGGTISLADPQYILAGSVPIEPILTNAGKILLGAVKSGSGTLWILSDPDLLSNAGIDEMDNGVVAISVIDALLPKGGTVIFDETLHGFEQRPNLMRTLLNPPFLPILIAIIVTAFVLAWAGIARFGAPHPETEGLAAGKLTLVKSAAKLLQFGTSAGNLLSSYRRLALSDAMNELHGPNGLDEAAQAAWLDRAAAHRGLDLRVAPVLERISQSGRIDATRALRFAHELYRWKQEIVHGTVVVPRGRRFARGVTVDGAQGQR